MKAGDSLGIAQTETVGKGQGKPGNPLRPEFIVPQDGDNKQDCEIKAGKRWLDNNAAFYSTGNDTILGDDLYAHQPFCRRVLRNNDHFIFVCKPDSHTHLYEWVGLLAPGVDIHTVSQRVTNKKNKWEQHTCRYANNVPLAEGEGALKVKLLATLNILAFLFHSFLTFCDDAYRLIRATLPTRQTFFDDIRALLASPPPPTVCSFSGDEGAGGKRACAPR